jgi:hypothetical protein
MAENDCKKLPPLTASDIERFWSKVNIRSTDECWLWIGCSSNRGYGLFDLSPARRRVKAHRISYFLNYREDPCPFFCCHRCDVKKCVNPSHLFLGSAADNNRDAAAKGHVQSGENHFSQRHPELIVRGEKHSAAKLKENTVIEIRMLYANGSFVFRDIASKFGVTERAIRSVVRRETWKHIVP